MYKDDILKRIEAINKDFEEKNIYTIYLNFIGQDGGVYSKSILVGLEKKQMNVSLLDGVGINGSLLPEWSDYKEAEWLLLVPELDTMKYTDLDEKYPSVFMMASFDSFELDSRECAKRVDMYARDMKVKPMNGTGICYKILDHNVTIGNGVYRIFPNSEAAEFNVDIAKRLQNTGILVEYFQPMGEQHNGIELVPANFLEAMDNLAIAKWYISAISAKKNIKIKFEIPKYEIDVSENPIHFSLWNLEGNRNLFFNEDDEMELSAIGKNFIGGILKYFKELTTIIMLSAGKKYIKEWKCSFSDERDDSIIHVPNYYKERKKHDRIGWGKRVLFNGFLTECNLHICVSAVFLAGLEGVRCKVDPEEYIDLRLVTGELHLDLLKKDSIFSKVLGREIIDYLINKDL